MATKRQIVSQLAQEDLGLLASAAEKSMDQFDAATQKRLKRAVKILRSVKPSAAVAKKKAG